MTTLNITEETWQFLVRYEHCTGTRINLQAVEQATGLKYKTIWGKMDKAKKALKADGFDFDAPATGVSPQKAATGKKRGAEDEADEDVQGKSPTKRAKKNKKAGSEGEVKVESTEGLDGAELRVKDEDTE